MAGTLRRRGENHRGKVHGQLAKGDPGNAEITVDVRGENLELKKHD